MHLQKNEIDRDLLNVIDWLNLSINSYSIWTVIYLYLWSVCVFFIISVLTISRELSRNTHCEHLLEELFPDNGSNESVLSVWMTQ